MIGYNFEIEFLGGRFDASSSSWAQFFYQKVLKRYVSEIGEKKLLLIAQIVSFQQTENLLEAKTYFGTPVAPLSPFTIAMKGHDRPFLETGTLFKSVAYQKVAQENIFGLSVYEVFIKNERADIALKLFRGQPSRGLPARPFFGVGAYLIRKIDIALES